jgi:hypothetical protein
VTLRMTVAGQTVKIDAHTDSVNDHGAMLQCARAIAAGTQIEIQHDRTGQKHQCRVTRRPLESQGRYLVPVEFTSPAPDFWHISFPTHDSKPAEE